MSYNERFTYIHAGQLDVPQMNGTDLTMFDVLDMALVEGGVKQDVDSVEILDNNSVRLHFLGSHKFCKRQLVSIVGANDLRLNGTHRITNTTTNTIDIQCHNVSLNSGSIKVSITPLGFESMFGKTNPKSRAYRSKNLNGTRTILYLKEADTSTGYHSNVINRALLVSVTVCNNMVDMDTPITDYLSEINVGDTNNNGNNFWYQARGSSKVDKVNDTINNKWVIFGNGDYFYFFNDWVRYSSTSNAGKGYRDLYAFGDVIPIGVDVNNCILSCTYNLSDNSTIYIASLGSQTGGTPPKTPILGNSYYITNIKGNENIETFRMSPSGYSSGYQSGYTTLITYPNPSSDSIITMPLYTYTSTGCIRGIMPRIMSIPQNITSSGFDALDLNVIDDSVLLVGVQYASSSSSTSHGYYALDVSGD